ncbi:hypothetical protein GQ464_010220 [Rhodocaloribacter litoris]|uniref:hypothetical protein n=1 Tax=Rhodocaloribacter litoris TaxID=2558931 RepID=UPI001424849C|nr:hypothetical protein [Rhodocaloribacter litoris]QXD13846.1 hypothetical protein GQ464_010220 [Rhodocaloribacter litoris]
MARPGRRLPARPRRHKDSAESKTFIALLYATLVALLLLFFGLLFIIMPGACT